MASKTVLQAMNDTRMGTETEVFEHLEPIHVGYGIVTIISAMAFFQLINKLIISATGLGDEKSIIAAASSRKEWQKRNLLISWMHAFIVSVWDILA